MGSTKATVKGHGLSVGDKVNFHGMASDSFPTIEGTPCVLGKDGNKYTLTSDEMSPTGTPWVWTFGAAAALWVSPVEKVEITEYVSDGVTLYSGECAHGWTTGLYANRDDATVVAAGHGEVSIPTYEAPKVEEIVSAPESLPLHFTEVCQMCQEAPRTHEVRTDGSFIGSISTPLRPVFHVCVACHGKIMATAESTASGWPNVVAVWVEDAPNGVYPYQITWQEPACRIYLALTLEDAQEIRRRVSPDYHRAINAHLVIVEPEVPATGRHAIPTNTPDIAGYRWQRYVVPGDSVTALSTYQLVQAGTTCQVAATVKYVKDGMWRATGCVWMSTGLTDGYWDGEPLADAFAHVVQYMTWVDSMRGSGIPWPETNRLDWRIPYVAPEVSEGECAAVAAADLNLGIIGYSKKGLPIFRNVLQPGRSLVTGRMVGAPQVKPACICDEIIDAGPKSLPRTGGRTCPCGSVFTRALKPLSAPIRTKLAKRARKASKRHAFAGKR